MKDDEKKPNPFATMTARALAGTLKHVKDAGSGLGEKGFFGEVLRDEEVQKEGAGLISEALNLTFDDIKNNVGSLVSEGSKKLNPARLNSYTLLRDSLSSPTDSIFKKITKSVFSRILAVGSGIASYIGAAFVNKLFNPAKKVIGMEVNDIFLTFMSKIIGPKKRAPAAA